MWKRFHNRSITTARLKAFELRVWIIARSKNMAKTVGGTMGMLLVAILALVGSLFSCASLGYLILAVIAFGAAYRFKAGIFYAVFIGSSILIVMLFIGSRLGITVNWKFFLAEIFIACFLFLKGWFRTFFLGFLVIAVLVLWRMPNAPGLTKSFRFMARTVNALGIKVPQVFTQIGVRLDQFNDLQREFWLEKKDTIVFDCAERFLISAFSWKMVCEPKIGYSLPAKFSKVKLTDDEMVYGGSILKKVNLPDPVSHDFPSLFEGWVNVNKLTQYKKDSSSRRSLKTRKVIYAKRAMRQAGLLSSGEVTQL